MSEAPFHKKLLGELNGPWVRGFKFFLSIIVPAICALITWSAGQLWAMGGRITDLEKKYLVVAEVISQLKTTVETLARHDREIAANAAAILALSKELGTTDQRESKFVLRKEWEMRNDTRDRELSMRAEAAVRDLAENRQAHEALMTKSDRLESKLDRLFERVSAVK